MNPKRQGILNQINHLTDNFCESCEVVRKDKLIYCRDECNVGKKLKVLGNQLDGDSRQKKIQNILSKGQDMTKSDIKKLLDYQVQKVEIRKALGMCNNSFFDMMTAFGFTKKREGVEEVANSKINMTVEQFVQWKYVEKLSYIAIGKKFGVGDAAIHYWKDKRKVEIEAALKALEMTKKEAVKITPKQDKNPEFDLVMNELANKLADTETALEEKEKLIKSLEAKVKELESVNAACADVEEEAVTLQNEVITLEDALSKEVELTRELTARLEEVTSKLEQRQKTSNFYEKENKALRSLVALWI
ncbi:zinc-finger domain-containing protein [Niallia sp. 03190]|uniref:zinc-finger domain-containing protein n=1 Tax=Niallia sp. 03190 TaxID=3458061 RepID=UPI004044F04A